MRGCAAGTSRLHGSVAATTPRSKVEQRGSARAPKAARKSTTQNGHKDDGALEAPEWQLDGVKGPRIVAADIKPGIEGRDVAVYWEVAEEGGRWFAARVQASIPGTGLIRIQYTEDDEVEDVRA